MRFFKHIKLLPVLILVAMLAFSVRVGDFVSKLKDMGVANAQQEVVAPMPSEELASAQPMVMAAAEEAESPDTVAEETTTTTSETTSPPPEDTSETWRDATEAEFEYSPAREELYQDLAARRQTLEDRERELEVREALLEAAERQLDQKTREMQALRNEIKGLLAEQSDEEKARIESLVKIYEGMKAKDAASIFNTLDIGILVEIMGAMSERKSAPILAEMAPERARNVTILLAEQKKLPSLEESYN